MGKVYTGTWDIETDVIVIGFGGAGGCAAIEAHSAGAEVIILEKQPENTHYSNTRMSGGGYHSPEPTGDKEALKAYAKAMFSGENLPYKFEGEQTDLSDELAALWAEYSPQNADFMRSLDPDYIALPGGGAAYQNFPGAVESEYRVYNSTYDASIKTPMQWDSPKTPKNKKQAGEAFHACILNGVTERNIPIHYETRASRLLFDDDGIVVGVMAQSNGKTLAYRASRAIVITSGGFEYNKALRSAFLEGPGIDGWAFYGTPSNTGDGIIMALEAGAALSKVGSAASRLIGSFPQLRSNGIRIGIAMHAVSREGGIVLDNFGMRFFDERDISIDPYRYIAYKHALAFDVKRAIYPRIPAWFIFDETLRTTRPLTHTNITEYLGVPWSEDNHEPIEKGWILKADSLEQLGNMIKEHPDNHGQMATNALCKSISRFNEFCINGEDKDFGRPIDSMGPVEKPPFYAAPLFPGGPNTKGGLKANAKRQVLDWEGNPIPRLYTAGEISSLFKYVYQAGGNVAECIVCGRVAGMNAASEDAM